MTINLIDIDTYNLLKSLQESYPNLTYQNTRFDYPDKSKWTDEDKKQFKTVTDILRNTIEGFVEFNHFVIHKKKSYIGIRFQYPYDSSFTGVGYIKLDELLKGNKKIEE